VPDEYREDLIPILKEKRALFFSKDKKFERNCRMQKWKRCVRPGVTTWNYYCGESKCGSPCSMVSYGYTDGMSYDNCRLMGGNHYCQVCYDFEVKHSKKKEEETENSSDDE